MYIVTSRAFIEYSKFSKCNSQIGGGIYLDKTEFFAFNL